ncbi:hypothetical protein [Roseicitreum antarcticum]|uniref:Lipoprotein n=1 Tax=Roseicitreum antarcticum TaxID=564137 RepID=A0A1H3CSX6_9RHOB|nr:hypothetical protein [Roseicitreum antarcticum]SDX57140.1 hypothetical protein SAMN04488238_11041 [Roseicitreum antarcticum]
MGFMRMQGVFGVVTVLAACHMQPVASDTRGSMASDPAILPPAITTRTPPMRPDPAVSRPVLSLTCDAATGPAAGICDQMQAALMQAAPGCRVVQVSKALLTHGAQDGSPQDGGGAVRLQILQMDAQGLSARLSWRQDDTWQQGPDLTLNVLDTPLRAGMLDRFVQDLVQVTALPFKD